MRYKNLNPILFHESEKVAINWTDENGKVNRTTYHTPQEKELWDERSKYMKKDSDMLGWEKNKYNQKFINNQQLFILKLLQRPENKELFEKFKEANNIINKANTYSHKKLLLTPLMTREVVNAHKTVHDIQKLILKKYGNEMRKQGVL